MAWSFGPGFVVMLADTDAGNVVTAAQAGTQWGYRLLPLLLALVPMLYLVQELTIRLGIFTGRGHGELIRVQFGLGWAIVSTIGLAAATIGSLTTEMSAIAGIGESYGIARGITLPAAAALLLLIVSTGSYRRVERIALIVGLFELAFFVIAWHAHPKPVELARDAVDLPLGKPEFLYLATAIIGATFNPWMVFYQQSAIADRRLGPQRYASSRWDTAIGAVITQLLTAAVLVAAAGLLPRGLQEGLTSASARLSRRFSARRSGAWSSASACSARRWSRPSSHPWRSRGASAKSPAIAAHSR